MCFREYIKQYFHFVLAISLVLLLPAIPLTASASGGQKRFSSPEKGVAALVSAVRANDEKGLVAIFGPDSGTLVSSGDRVADLGDRKKFLAMYDEYHSIDKSQEGRALLLLGNEKYPFPFPLLKKGKHWVFDRSACVEEVLNRRIGRNELTAIQVVRAYLDAQREYVARDRDGDGIPAFAARFRSAPGKRDGLYWESAPGEDESPFGPLVAQAAREGYGKGEEEFLSPYNGYFFRILTSQGERAEGGAYDYMVNGKMVLGFALIAYPAQYGVSGIMTFMVNQGGVVFERDLGPETAAIVESISAFSPDANWKKMD